jgi:hypothetical protein
MHPSSSRAFQRHEELDLKHPGSVDLITTKQNNLPFFIYKLNLYKKGLGYVLGHWREELDYPL